MWRSFCSRRASSAPTVGWHRRTRSAVGPLIVVVASLVALFPFSAVHAQDSAPAYPWRLSYFPYIVASPTDGVMGIAHAIWFRQSPWDARTPLDASVDIDAGYSTKNAWLARANGEWLHLKGGLRLDAIVEGTHTDDYLPAVATAPHATRADARVELSVPVVNRLYLALLGEGIDLTLDLPADPGVDARTVSQRDARGRIALVYDGRNREYDTRSGVLLQGGLIGGVAGEGYGGAYGIGALWIPIGDRVRLTTRGGYREYNRSSIDADRFVPAWEDEFEIGGGPESNRALPVGAMSSRKSAFWDTELRADLFVFPGGAISAVGFFDATRADAPITRVDAAAPVVPVPDGWVGGAGGGLALRFLRNAVLEATAGRAEGATRFYVTSGWSW